MALLPKGQREQSLILVCLLAVAAVGAYWYFVFAPHAADLAAKRQRLEAIETLNQRVKAELATGSVSDLQAQLAQYRSTLAVVRTLVPASNEVPALLEQVSTAARREGLDLASVDPQPVIHGEAYDTYRYAIGVLGGYHALGAFFTNVGSLTRIVLPTEVSLHPSTVATTVKSHQQAGTAVIEARFQLETFVVPKSAGGAQPGLASGPGAE